MKEGKPNPFEIDFDSYILQAEPDKHENGKLWQTAIGLQRVDGLTPSKYLYETAKRNIDGEITIEQAKKLIDSYYETRKGRASDYDFDQEKSYDYSKISKDDTVKHLTRFVANIWQIHPFGEGNTRTTAVFTVKYLNSLGFEVNNGPFERNSWYFRNALVRANYTNMNKGIYMNTEYLEKFFRNLLLGEKNELRNRYCHIKYVESVAEKVTPKVTVNVTVKYTENQKKILKAIKKNPFVTQEELAGIVGVTRKSINENMKKLQNLNVIKSIGADKNGHWEIIKG